MRKRKTFDQATCLLLMSEFLQSNSQCIVQTIQSVEPHTGQTTKTQRTNVLFIDFFGEHL